MFFSFNSNKMFFLFILFFSTLISISSNSWFGCWIGLEINLLSFIPLINNSNNLLSSEASLKYFLVQSIASINLLFCIILKLIFMKNFEMNNFLSIMINSSLLMKMGSAPFHFWFPNIVEGLSWFNNLILMTWQKISPIILLSYFMNKNFLIIIVILNSIIGAVGGFNQISLRKLMAFSSINNLGWMISSMMISENLWMFYFFFYSFLISIMCLLFYYLNMFFINQLFFCNINFMIKLFLLINFLSIGGLPPFIGFFPKWIIINFLLQNNFYFLTFILIMMSLILLFFYIRILYSSFMFNYLKLKWMKILFKNKMMYFINFFSFISISGMILSTFFFM
uniref:NADH-ubiquinone oxidoreductase chain 2 n=1 Tax=Conogethes punctiferalis TaxID=1133088 RepID=R4IKD8_CONPF|nr:NADH dehydrogenase subunit 2 [Conogethes punctiferalis]AFR25722.1 NADH dehydrogenase subunit 2 [Conogethes punctiferalis]